MDLLNVLSKLTAIETGVVAEEGTKVAFEKATGSNSDIENVLRGLMSIQEESAKPDFLDLDKDGDKEEPMADAAEEAEKVEEAVEQLEECGEWEMPTPEAMPAAPMYTLNIRNGESNLSMTTSVPDEIVAIMKLAGLKADADVAPQAPVEEDFANTPAQTNERSPRLHGDIADWGMKGTANAKTHYTPASQGDNPLGEDMMEQYKKFKQSK